MKTRRGLSFFLLAIVLSVFGSGVASALTIRSWDDANQRGGDLFGAADNSFEYGSLANALLARGHTILPGVSTLAAADLGGVNVFFHGTSSHVISAAEAEVLSDFVANGGCLIVEANSDPNEQAAGNAMLSALGLGNRYTGVTGGNQGPDAGLFENVATSTTVGPAGNVMGLTFGSSIVVELSPGPGTVVGRNQELVCWLEFATPTRVLAVGDPYGFGLFQTPGDTNYNPNNQIAYINFIENCEQPTPVAPKTWGAVKALYQDATR